jgi:hypothetical protein
MPKEKVSAHPTSNPLVTAFRGGWLFKLSVSKIHKKRSLRNQAQAPANKFARWMEQTNQV